MALDDELPDLYLPDLIIVHQTPSLIIGLDRPALIVFFVTVLLSCVWLCSLFPPLEAVVHPPANMYGSRWDVDGDDDDDKSCVY